MLNILVNAYAVSPNWGSEQGLGWNWVINLAKYCHLDVITEGEWHDDIEIALKDLPQRSNLKFHYLPVSEKIRKMCWNQGDWRFYWHYEKWQRRALEKAREICANKHIDVLHQLNMIGFREPGYLWKIENIPFVWGPIGGMELMPLAYLHGASWKQRIFNKVKNQINKYQYSHSRRVRKAIERSSALVSAVKGVRDVLSSIYDRNSFLINETGIALSNDAPSKTFTPSVSPLKIIWVGKLDFRKQLPLALRSVIATEKRDIELHVCGAGSEIALEKMWSIAEAGNITSQLNYHGVVPHDKMIEMMKQSDLMLFTSIMEATSTVVLEALSVGLPVICFNTCGFGPIVKDFAGITVELSDLNKSVNEFAYQILKVYNNREILKEISSRIIANRDAFTWDSKARKILDIYRQITIQ